MFTWVANSLAGKGHEVIVFTFSKGNDNGLHSNIKVINKNLDGISLFRKVLNIRRIIREFNPVVSISFLLDANIYNTLACLGLKTKSIICERNDPYKPHYYKLKLLKPIFRLSDGGVFQLSSVMDYYSMIKKNKIVIPNPVIHNTDVKIETFDNREKSFVSLGRLDLFQKRQDVLIKAFAIFQFHHQDYILKIYGDGPDKEKLVNVAKEEGISDKVIFCGVTNTPIDAIRTSKAFILTSDFEGIPNSLIEAMSIGVPCISTDCRPGGASFLIQNNINGLLVNCGDIIGLSNAMEYLISNPDFSDEMGKKGMEIKYELSEERISEKWNNFLCQLAT